MLHNTGGIAIPDKWCSNNLNKSIYQSINYLTPLDHQAPSTCPLTLYDSHSEGSICCIMTVVILDEWCSNHLQILVLQNYLVVILFFTKVERCGCQRGLIPVNIYTHNNEKINKVYLSWARHFNRRTNHGRVTSPPPSGCLRMVKVRLTRKVHVSEVDGGGGEGTCDDMEGWAGEVYMKEG